jgi:transcription initiation factor TFIID TATA-box-binding protein
MSKIRKIDEGASEEDLEDIGLSVENIVATLDLGQEFDLMNLVEFLDESEYEPETTPFLIYRPSAFKGTVLIPTNGMASFVGCKSKHDLIQLSNHLISRLSDISPKELPSSSDLEIQNIVIQGNLGTELELTEIALLFGMERTEYEPEQFPGVIYRPSDGRTVLLFSSGKFMMNGGKCYKGALATVKNLVKDLRDSGVPIDTELI